MPKPLNFHGIKSFAFSLIVLTSCVRIEIPPDAIPPAQMVQVLTDIHLLEGRRAGEKVLYTNNDLIEDYYKVIFQKHSITEEQYRRSHKYYTEYPDVFSKIYEQVIDQLQRSQIEKVSQDTTHHDNF